MKTSILVALFMLCLCIPSFCDDSYQYSNSTRVGNTTFHSGYSNGTYYNGTSQTIGNTTFHNGYGSNGSSYVGNSQQIGNSSFTNVYSFGDNN